MAASLSLSLEDRSLSLSRKPTDVGGKSGVAGQGFLSVLPWSLEFGNVLFPGFMLIWASGTR